MPKLNENYLNLKESYLFAEINHRVKAYQEANPDKKIIRLGIGDVTLPIGSKMIEQLHEGVDAMASSDTFKGYGPEQGYDFLAEEIIKNDTVLIVSNLTKYLFLMVLKVIQVTSLICLHRTMLS